MWCVCSPSPSPSPSHSHSPSGQYVYVTDIGAHKIVVFTTEGDYVTSFGDCESYGVCVDQDGFVYVTDFSTCKINIF